MSEIKEKIVEVVNRIPRQQVTNYGEVAKVVVVETGRRITAQMIGWQLSGMPQHEWMTLPRWRVVAKSGYVSSLKHGDKGWKQIQLLEEEGIDVIHNTVDMELYGISAEQLGKSG